MARNLRTYPTGEDVLDAFIRTLTADDVYVSTLPQESYRALYSTWRKFWRRAGLNNPSFVHLAFEECSTEEILLATRYLKGQLKAAYGRRFFLTSKCYFNFEFN